MNVERIRRRLLWFGVLLFLLGLITGFVIPELTNPRMGLSAHLEGVMNGMFLILIGIIWKEVKLPHRSSAAVFWLALYGTYVNWASTLLAAIFGTSRLTAIMGAEQTAAEWQENIVNFGLVSLSIAMIVCCILLLWGLSRRKAEDKDF